VVGSALRLFPDAVRAHVDGALAGVEPMLTAPIAELVDDRFVLDDEQRTKQPDWSHDPVDSGQWPADRFDDPRRAEG
jgi:hypothetical protein